MATSCWSGILADEFVNPGFIPSRTEVDLRLAQPTTAGLAELFQSLHRARSAAEDAAVALQTFGTDPNADTGIPEMHALAGYTYIYAGGGLLLRRDGQPCGERSDRIWSRRSRRRRSWIPRSPGSAWRSPTPALRRAIRSTRWPRWGSARALLDEGRFPEAAAAVASVPPDFLYETEHSTTPAALHNGVFEAFNNGEFGIEDHGRRQRACRMSPREISGFRATPALPSDNNTETLVSQQVLRLRRVGPTGGLCRSPADHRRK